MKTRGLGKWGKVEGDIIVSLRRAQEEGSLLREGSVVKIRESRMRGRGGGVPSIWKDLDLLPEGDQFFSEIHRREDQLAEGRGQKNTKRLFPRRRRAGGSIIISGTKLSTQLTQKPTGKNRGLAGNGHGLLMPKQPLPGSTPSRQRKRKKDGRTLSKT